MNVNFENIIRKNLPKNIIQPKRAMIYIGFQCHQKCGFCYYKYKCNEPMFDFNVIKLQIDFEYEYGIREFEITGGEPSEYINLRQVCQYIKDKDSNLKIAIITNGGLWKSNVWDLIDEVLVSYHLGRNTDYDRTIFPLGCTYNKVKKTIDLAHNTGKLVRTNTVCAVFNLNQLDAIINDLIELKPSIINFLPVNMFELSKDMLKYIDYSKLREKLKKQIDILNIALNNPIINIRYMPFCDMDGYLLYIKGYFLNIYDPFDWNVELGGRNILSHILEYKKMLLVFNSYGSLSLSAANNLRNKLYKKTDKCLKCKFFILCDGIEKLVDIKYIYPINGISEKNILLDIKSKKLHDFLYGL